MLVNLTSKNPHRVEVFGNMSPAEFLLGTKEPHVFWPYVPAKESGGKKDADDEAYMGFQFDRYLELDYNNYC